MIQNAIQFHCPCCQQPAAVSQVQGDRCPSCSCEFKWFGPGEERMADDYLAVLSGPKYRLDLPNGQGRVIAHA